MKRKDCLCKRQGTCKENLQKRKERKKKTSGWSGGFLAKRRTSPTRDDMDVLLARSMRDAFLVLPPLRQTGYYIHTHVRSTLTLVGDGRHACTPKRKFIHHQSQSQECNYPRPMSLGV